MIHKYIIYFKYNITKIVGYNSVKKIVSIRIELVLNENNNE